MLQTNLVVKDHGIFELLMSIYTFAITFANSGISLAATRIVSEELDGNNGKNLKLAMRKCILYSLFFGLIALVLLFISARLLFFCFAS